MLLRVNVCIVLCVLIRRLGEVKFLQGAVRVVFYSGERICVREMYEFLKLFTYVFYVPNMSC